MYILLYMLKQKALLSTCNVEMNAFSLIATSNQIIDLSHLRISLVIHLTLFCNNIWGSKISIHSWTKVLATLKFWMCQSYRTPSVLIAVISYI